MGEYCIYQCCYNIPSKIQFIIINYEACKETQDCAPIHWEKKTSTESAYDSDKMSDLPEKDFKVVIKTMFTELAEIMIKDAKEDMATMLHQIEIH